jgi:amino acid adenylation domain-containing protein
MNLGRLFADSAVKTSQAPALHDSFGNVSYAELENLVCRMAHAFRERGVRAGDRVGLWLEKSRFGIAAMQAALRLGAAYVPVDPLSPVSRARLILDDCAVRMVVTSETRAKQLHECGAASWSTLLFREAPGINDWDPYPATPVECADVDENNLAYILYTSGSTGKPKGVCLSHRNALAFIRWSVTEFQPTSVDRFSSHAPFHFDLSVFDIYVCFAVGAALFVVPEEMSYAPGRLAEFILKHKISVWYSVPFVWVMMLEQGEAMNWPEVPIRILLFAGEPFPIKPLRQLFEAWSPRVRFFNLYGPTETNVCTFHEVRAISPAQIKPVSIGVACCGDTAFVRGEDEAEAGVGEEGELVISGPTVMLGYWGQPPLAGGVYATGDWVKRSADGTLDFVGRRDQMVKVRGYRIELGEIEASLAKHPAIRDVAVVVRPSGGRPKIVACVVRANGEPLHLLLLKKYCSEHLPRYMIVDDVVFLEELPRTRNGKVDRRRLAEDDAAA